MHRNKLNLGERFYMSPRVKLDLWIKSPYKKNYNCLQRLGTTCKCYLSEVWEFASFQRDSNKEMPLKFHENTAISKGHKCTGIEWWLINSTYNGTQNISFRIFKELCDLIQNLKNQIIIIFFHENCQYNAIKNYSSISVEILFPELVYNTETLYKKRYWPIHLIYVIVVHTSILIAFFSLNRG